VTSGQSRATYREVLAVPEFRAIFVSQGLSLIGDHVARIAIALLVYGRTGSAFAASATYGCSFLTWLVGGPFLSALADRHRRRRIMIVTDLARFVLIALLLVPHPPL
jgi:MFS family permease